MIILYYRGDIRTDKSCLFRRAHSVGWVGLGWVGLGWAGLGWVGFGWVGLDWAGLGSVSMASFGLVWVCRSHHP